MELNGIIEKLRKNGRYCVVKFNVYTGNKVWYLKTGMYLPLYRC